MLGEMKQNAFTLMELMIVIVIIGILSAVGMVMFGGQAEKAKIAVAKSNHKTLVKFIKIGATKCELGETFKLKLSSGGLNFSEVDRCNLVLSRNAEQLQSRIQHHFKVETYFKNWCMIDGKNCQEAVADGGSYGLSGALYEHEIHSCSNSNISDCGTLVIETRYSDTEFLRDTIKF